MEFEPERTELRQARIVRRRKEMGELELVACGLRHGRGRRRWRWKKCDPAVGPAFRGGVDTSGGAGVGGGKRGKGGSAGGVGERGGLCDVGGDTGGREGRGRGRGRGIWRSTGG